MKVFLSRVSTDEQSELRQIQNVEGFDKVIIDKCSGLIPLWERPNVVKHKIEKLVNNGTIKHIETNRKILLIIEHTEPEHNQWQPHELYKGTKQDQNQTMHPRFSR